jgi:hypothetical protein
MILSLRVLLDCDRQEIAANALRLGLDPEEYPYGYRLRDGEIAERLRIFQLASRNDARGPVLFPWEEEHLPACFDEFKLLEDCWTGPDQYLHSGVYARLQRAELDRKAIEDRLRYVSRPWDALEADERNQMICLAVARDHRGVSVEVVPSKANLRPFLRRQRQRERAKDACQLLASVAVPSGRLDGQSDPAIADFIGKSEHQVKTAREKIIAAHNQWAQILREMYPFGERSSRVQTQLFDDWRWLVIQNWTELSEAGSVVTFGMARDFVHLQRKMQSVERRLVQATFEADTPLEDGDEYPLTIKKAREGTNY